MAWKACGYRHGVVGWVAKADLSFTRDCDGNKKPRPNLGEVDLNSQKT